MRGAGSDGDWRVAEHRQRLGVLSPAPAAQHQHPGESENGPAAAAESLLPRADLAIGKAQHPGHEQRQKKQPQIIGSAMNMKLPAYQWGLNGKNGRTP